MTLTARDGLMNTSNNASNRAVPNEMINKYELRLTKFATIFLRLTLSAGFLAAVSDRFGLWGPPGTTNVAWGDFGHFLAYAAILNPELPTSWIPAIGWIVTFAETIFAITLLLGYQTRTFALLSGLMLLAFASGMTIGTGIKSALDASVFSASAGAFLLATVREYSWSLDALKEGKNGPSASTAKLRETEKQEVTR